MAGKETELFLILVESEIELVPENIQGHPSIRKSARSRGKKTSGILLDSSMHHKAMSKLDDSHRRGRPDILHFCLMLGLDSFPNKMGRLGIYVQTRHGELIRVNPEVRLPKNYNRFTGLMEQLLEKGEVRSEDMVLLKVEDRTLGDLLTELDTYNVLLSEDGEDVDLVEFFKEHAGKKIAVMVGGFPHGDFKIAKEHADALIRVTNKKFSASTIVAKVLFSYEEALK